MEKRKICNGDKEEIPTVYMRVERLFSQKKTEDVTEKKKRE